MGQLSTVDPVSLSLNDNPGFWIFENTIGHLAPRVAPDRNLAPFDTAAILARSFSVQFTARRRRGPTDIVQLKRCSPIYLPSIAFGSVPTVSDIYVTHRLPSRIVNNAKIHLK